MKTSKNNARETNYRVNKEIIQIRNKLHRQIDFLNTGALQDIGVRIKCLKKLKHTVKKYENDIMKALYEDLKKSNAESYMTEISVVYQEIDHVVANAKKWAKPKKVSTPYFLRPARSWTVPEPFGQVLIIGPWNYPFQLVIAPLINAVAAGNVAILKPSEISRNTSSITAKIISEAFDPSHAHVVEGGIEITRFLLSEEFDYIFFTGGTGIGKIIMEAAAKHLTPITLELGGKSPAIVNNDAGLDSAARKIVWGKFLNAGQTCIAPDYLLVHKGVSDKLIERMRFHIRKFYGDDPKASPYYSRIININHFNRIKNLMKNTNIVIGGQTGERQLYISPTVVKNTGMNHPLMKEEIFGPVLPVTEFRNIDEAIRIVRSMPKPLSLYLYTSSKKLQARVSRETSSGGLVINDCLVHFSNYHLPFGGVGASGMGAYHGKTGFDTFSHKKPVMKGSSFIDMPLRYPPFEKKLWLLRLLLR